MCMKPFFSVFNYFCSCQENVLVVKKVTDVIDGDTFQVDFHDHDFRIPFFREDISIQVAGIDAPEVRRPKCDKEKEKAKEVKKYVSDLLYGARSIKLTNFKFGLYGRLVADVDVDGESLAELLIDKGFAVEYDGKGGRHDWCK